MSFNIARQPIPNLLPALTTLQQYHRNYNYILGFLEQFSAAKEKEIDNVQQDIKRFVSIADHTVDQLHEEIQKLEQSVKISSFAYIEPDTVMKQLPQVSTIKRSTRNDRKQKINPKKQVLVEGSPLRTLATSQRQRLKEKIMDFRRTRSIIAQGVARTHLKPNLLVSQLQLQFSLLNHENENWRKILFQFLKFSFCQICSMPIQSSKNHYFLKCHFEKHHKDLACRKPTELYFAKQMFALLKEKIDKNDLIIYKCNCMRQPSPSKQAYIQHILKEHNGQAPTFSSHFLLNPQDHSLVENKDRNQYLVLEEVLAEELFYCGTCHINFVNCIQFYYEHALKFHRGAVGNTSSHFLVENDPHNRIRNQPVQPVGRITRRNKSISQHRIPSRSTIKNKKPKPKPQALIDLFEDELKMLQIMQGYKGNFYCCSCQIQFQSYEDMKNHFQSGVSFRKLNHFRTKQLFVMVHYHLKPSNSQKCFRTYFLPLDLSKLDSSLKQIKLNVPIYKHGHRNVERWQSMTYQQFIQYVNETRINNPPDRLKKFYYSWAVK